MVVSEQSSALVGVSSRVSTLGEHVSGLPLLSREAAQLGRGKLEFVSMQVSGRDVILFETLLKPKYSGSLVPDPEWCSIFVPLRWRGDFFFNGREAQPNDLFLNGGPNGYATVGEGRHSLSIGLRKARLRELCKALTGNTSEDLNFPDQRFTYDGGLRAHLLRDVKAAMRASMNTPIERRRYTLPASVEADLLTTIALYLTAQGVAGQSRDPGRVEALSVVRKAKSLIDSKSPQPVTLCDLCRASGVGKVWLHKCFVEIYGISPMRYLRAQRLTAARDRLLDRLDPPRSVKDVALSLGFVHGGRFAAEYRNLFGENPLDTLTAQHH